MKKAAIISVAFLLMAPAAYAFDALCYTNCLNHGGYSNGYCQSVCGYSDQPQQAPQFYPNTGVDWSLYNPQKNQQQQLNIQNQILQNQILQEKIEQMERDEKQRQTKQQQMREEERSAIAPAPNPSAVGQQTKSATNGPQEDCANDQFMIPRN